MSMVQNLRTPHEQPVHRKGHSQLEGAGGLDQALAQLKNVSGQPKPEQPEHTGRDGSSSFDFAPVAASEEVV